MVLMLPGSVSRYDKTTCICQIALGKVVCAKKKFVFFRVFIP
jgi:hypothetical protein